MKCSFCGEIALFKCACPMPFFCRSHLGHHFASMPIHPIENIDIDLPAPKLDRVNSEIMNRILKLKRAKAEISRNTKGLANLIDSLCNATCTKLDVILNNYMRLLGRQKFSQTEIEEIEKIDLMKIKVKKVKVDGISQLINET